VAAVRHYVEAGSREAALDLTLIVSACDVLFAVIVVCWVFGWSGGKALVESSYADAKVKGRELKAKRKKA
jgi:hypothetical protein